MATAIDPSPVAQEASVQASVKTTASASPARREGAERFEIERPKEHGAYAMLAVPLVTAFVIGGFTWIGLAVAAASVLGFIAHEPIMIATGRRGPRALREAPRARVRAMALLTAASLLGLPAMMLGSLPVRLALFVCLPVAAACFVLAANGKQRSLATQLWSSLGLVLPSLVVMLAASMELERALQISGAWLVAQSGSLVAVRSVIAKHKKNTQGRVPLTNDLLQLAFTLAALIGIFSGYTPFLCVLPMIAVASYLRIFPPSPKHLRQLGWSLVASHLASALAMIALQAS